jgi:CubicO group peptidase (beta-lactamase class C family)
LGAIVLGDSLIGQDKSLDPKKIDAKAALADFDQYVNKALEQWHVPGVAIAIVKSDEVLLSKGYGVREIRSADPVDEHTLFAIASNSKAFTAAALAILVDEGKVQWDDLVTKHLPWFRLKDTYATNDIRVRDLLCHRSGLGTFSGDLLWWGTSYSPRQVLERAFHLEPESSFRSNYGYSNLMFLAAGEVIESASGQKWSEFVQDRIIKPLEMRRTITSVRDLIATGNYATPHKTLLDDSKPIAWMNWDTMAAAGGIISSAEDMSKWLRLQLKRGKLSEERRVFSHETAHEMWQSQTPIKLSATPSARFSSTHFRSYGLGWALSDYEGRKIVGHGGGYDGMYSQVLIVPEEEIGVVVLTNSMTSITGLLAYRAVDLLLGTAAKDWSEENLTQFRKSREEFAAKIKKAISPVVQGTQPSHPIEAYAGTFRCPMYGDATVEVEAGKLVLKLLPYPALVADLKHLHYDTFEIQWRNEFAWFDGGTAHFVPNARGSFQRIELDVPNEDLWFHELKLTRQK